MSFIPLDQVGFQQSATDAFGRLRVSNPETIFDTQFEYTTHPLLWEFVSSGAGAEAHDPSVRHITLSTSGANDRALRRTKVYHRYQPGKSQLVKMTGVPLASGTHSATSETRVGYYDDENGIFFATNTSGNHFVRRTSTSGSPVDNPVAQAGWNIDTFDGSGPSGVTLDPATTQIVVIDLQWLGVGRVRCGFQIDGKLYYAHEFNHANSLTVPYMVTANLPLTYEITNGANAATLTMTEVCGAIESEGGQQTETGYIVRAGTAGTTVSCANAAALTPIFSVRLVDLFGTRTYRGHVHPLEVSFLATTSTPGYFELVWNANLTGATFANSADATYSGVEYDTAATSFTGGFVVKSGYISGGGTDVNPDTATSAGLDQKLILARTYTANVRDTLTVAARGVGGAATLAATMNLLEQY